MKVAAAASFSDLFSASKRNWHMFLVYMSLASVGGLLGDIQRAEYRIRGKAEGAVGRKGQVHNILDEKGPRPYPFIVVFRRRRYQQRDGRQHQLRDERNGSTFFP